MVVCCSLWFGSSGSRASLSEARLPAGNIVSCASLTGHHKTADPYLKRIRRATGG